jgi:hypothetical protein
MPKTVEYHSKGIREVYSKPHCHSCWDCQHCADMVDVTQYFCRARGLSSLRDRNFPYDNTKCKEFREKDGKNS